jgi:hypothetical protein
MKINTNPIVVYAAEASKREIEAEHLQANTWLNVCL